MSGRYKLERVELNIGKCEDDYHVGLPTGTALTSCTVGFDDLDGVNKIREDRIQKFLNHLEEIETKKGYQIMSLVGDVRRHFRTKNNGERQEFVVGDVLWKLF